MFSLRNIIIQKETKTGVSQWHLNRQKSFTILLTVFFLSVTFIYLSADLLSTYLYEKRLDEFKLNYNNVSSNIEKLKKRLQNLDNQINIIEKKDNAVRSYAGMPEIENQKM